MVEEPAFYHVIESANGESIGKIKYHQKLLEAIMSSSSSFFVPRLLPMIVPPRPWQAPDNGGYLTHSRSQPLIRMHGNIYQAAMVDEADKKGYLHTIYHALDVLGATPWRVNRRLLDVCMQCWNEGSEWVR